MSVQELEAQISAICEDIAQQKQLLKALERSKSLLQRQLNDIRDPISRLPVEISSEIFLHGLAQVDKPLGYHSCGIDYIPALFLQVCHAWTEIALSTTALWTELHIVLPCSPGFPAVLERRLDRGGDQLLDLRITINVAAGEHEGVFDQGVGAVLQRHSKRLESLTIELEEHASSICIPFEATETEPLTSLRSLTVVGHTASECPWSPLLQLLRRSPNLVNLNIQDLKLRQIALVDFEHLVLPHLRQLDFGRDPADPEESNDEFFQCITAPELEMLRIWFLNGLSGELLSFLTRSSPPLERFTFDCFQMGAPTELLGPISDVVPTLTTLEVACPDFETIATLASVLTRTSPSKALPNLRTLELQFSPFHQMPDSWWNLLLPALQARRTEIRVMRIFVYPGDGNVDPVTLDRFASPNIIPILKELAAGGMEVWIGPVEQNLFSP